MNKNFVNESKVKSENFKELNHMNITQQKEKIMEQFENNFIENSLMILTEQTVNVFLKQKNNSELIALYVFYYYTAKWQKTNQPKCTTGYVANALHWDIRKVRKVKKQLIELGLIEDVRKIDPETKKVVGYYIKMNYIFKKETVEKSQCTKNQTLEFEYTSDNNIHSLLEKNQGCKNALLGGKAKKRRITLENIDVYPGGKNALLDEKARGAICHPVAICTPNALSVNNINALSINNINKEKEIYKEKELPSFSLCVSDSEFSKFWAEYPRKEKKDRAKRAFLKKRKAGVEFELILDGLKKHKQKWAQENTKLKYIPHPASWINDERWNDEIVISENESKPSYNIDEYVETMDTFAVAPTYSAQIKRKQEEQNRDLAELERIKKQEKDIWIKDFGTRRSKFLLNAKTLKQLEHDKEQLTRMKENKDFVWVEEKGDYFYQFEIEKMKNEEDYFTPPQMPLTASITFESMFAR